MRSPLKIITSILLAAMFVGSVWAEETRNPIGDFFKRLGNSIAHPHVSPSPTPSAKRKSAVRKRQRDQEQAAAANAPSTTVSPSPTPTPPPPVPMASPTPALRPAAKPTPAPRLAPRPTPPPKRAPMPVPIVVRSAVSVPPSKKPLPDLPFGIPLPNKPGFVTSPYAPRAGYVDVRGFASGTEVKDPYTGRNFLVP